MSRISSRTIGRAIASLALLVAASSAVQAQEAGLPLGTHAPDAPVQMLDGTAAKMSQFMGKTPVVIEFWATWCPLCKKLEPQFKASKEKHGDAVTFLNVGVNSNQSRERQQAYVTANELKGNFVFDMDGKAVEMYKVPHTSHVLVLDKQGMVVYAGVGTEQNIEDAIAKAMMKK